MSPPTSLILKNEVPNDEVEYSSLKEYVNKWLEDKKEKDFTYFQTHEDRFQKQPATFSVASQQDYDGLKASYNISLLIAKAGKPQTVGEELILPCVKEVLSSVIHHETPDDVIRAVPLSNIIVQQRIDEMAWNVESNLYSFLRTSQFSMQLDESTLPGNKTLLLAYVRFTRNSEVGEELLFVRIMETDSRGEAIFDVVKGFFEEERIPLTNIMSVASDGASAMVRKHRGFIAHLKTAVPNVLAVHHVIHRQHLVSRNLSDRLHQSLQFVIKAVNRISANALNTRLFELLCEENEDFEYLILHTKVRWLSKGACLSRFYSLFDPVVQILESVEDELSGDLKSQKTDIAYLTDLFAKFNESNQQLQGDDLNLIKTKSVISAFVGKLNLWRRNLRRGIFDQFPLLSALREEGGLHVGDVEEYCDHLKELRDDFHKRFKDLLTMKIPSWVIDPFSENEETEVALQEELIDIKSNDELKPEFKKSYQRFWLQKPIAQQYPGLWAIVQKYLIAFPSSYLVERGFSVFSDLIFRKIPSREYLRLRLTKIEPNIEQLIQAHQLHPSH